MMIGHGLYVYLCVCGETTKNKIGPKKGDGIMELIVHLRVSNNLRQQ
jgi:hypothetical protein